MDAEYEALRRRRAALNVLGREEELTVAGVRLSVRGAPEEGEVVILDDAEAAQVMAAIGDIMRARIVAANAQLEI